MSLEDYLEFLGPDVIRLKGHHIGLEQVFAVLAYYLHNQADVDAYIKRLDDYAAEQQRISDANPSPVALRLRALKAERERSAS